jgi:hypothetical protein
MTPLSEMLTWIASHPGKFRRKDYEPPNHLANGTVRFFGADGPTFDLKLDAQGAAADYAHDPPPKRIEIYGGNGELLFAEDA